ncbi:MULTISPECIES: FkbM family methyltransferase [unclassified Frankia]
MDASDVLYRTKISIAGVLTSPAVGTVIAAATRNRVPNHGLRFDVADRDFTPQARAALFWRLYEGAEIRMIRRHLTTSGTVVELGASLGITSAHIASRLAPGSRLVCVEANPHLIEGLTRRLAAYAGHITLDVENRAITQAVGPVAFALVGNNLGSRLWDDASRRTVTIPAATLRDLLVRRRIAEFDLVSDIEGAEASFLLGDPGALDRCRRAVFEMHDTTFEGRPVTAADLLDAARGLGFQVVDRHGVVVTLSRDG